MNDVVAFAGVAALLTITPGPDTLLVVRVGTVHGRRGALAAGLGVCAALSAWGCAAAFGLAAVLAASPVLFTVLRWGGAAYLAYLGLRAFGVHTRTALPEAGPPAHRHFLRGAATNASNPKIGVFYLSLLPQFVPAGVPVLAGSLLLAGIHVTESAAWLVLAAFLSGKLARLLSRPGPRRWAGGVSGVAFLGFAARLAFRG